MLVRRAPRLLVALVFAASTLLCAQRPATTPTQQSADAQQTPGAIGDIERSALTFTRYDLSVQLRPQTSGISVAAHVTVRNDGAAPLAQLPLQISSSLHWDVISEQQSGRTEKLSFNQHLLQTDADHTGAASEAILRLPQPLEPHASAELTLLYAGSIPPSTARLDRQGTPAATASLADWDVISGEGTFLRGFGNVLWYPVASPQLFLGEGAGLLRASGEQMQRQQTASVHLRLSIEYTGEAPAAAFFCGRQQPLTLLSDNANAPVAEAPGIGTADFETQELGFRTLSLFVTSTPPVAANGALAAVSDDPTLASRLSTASAPILTLLSDWLGSSVAHTLTVIDHPGTPFADGDLLVEPAGKADTPALTSDLVPSLTHARFRSVHPWLDGGVAQFMSLLWVERTQGRPATLGALQEQSHALALAESLASPSPADRSNEGLLGASEAVFYRSKAVAVLWQLREIVGDDALKHALQRYARSSTLDADIAGFEKVLEQTSSKDLHWFFADWVDHDRGLPDLTILSVAPRKLTSGGKQGSGWLVAVEVRNDGGAVAEVPVTVRSGALTATERLRIPAHAVASTRVLFQDQPEQVQVNDGSVPEMIASTHLQNIAK